MNFPADAASIANDDRIHPAFRRGFVAAEVARLQQVELEPLLLSRAATKQEPRRFSGEAITGFGGIGVVGSDRHREVMDEEWVCQCIDEQRERAERGE